MVGHIGKTTHRIAWPQLVFLRPKQPGQGDGTQSEGRFFKKSPPGMSV
jgi:hypothetical protein